VPRGSLGESGIALCPCAVSLVETARHIVVVFSMFYSSDSVIEYANILQGFSSIIYSICVISALREGIQYSIQEDLFT
jgi:hypothetical protein